jgi:tRNA(Ile)-lysidine synthase
MLHPGVITETLVKWASAKSEFNFKNCAVAFSGGADSTALLFALAQLASEQRSAQQASNNPAAHAKQDSNKSAQFITAIHIHHGLQAAADSFATHCEAFCVELSQQFPIRFLCECIAVELNAGDSLEERAREARYDALVAAAKRLNINTVLLAHHADDQAESMVLALSRGAGLAGLSGMAVTFERDGVRFERPLLELPGEVLKASLVQSKLSFIEDPTNADERFTRNRLRRTVMPAIEAAIPAFRSTFARSARHAAQAQRVLESVAVEDLRKVALEEGGRGTLGSGISLERMLSAVEPLRWPNLLRHWLKTAHQVTPSAAQLDELCAQIATSQRHGAPRRMRLKVAHGFALREGDLLSYVSNNIYTPT